MRVAITVNKGLARRLFHPDDLEFLMSFASLERPIEGLPEKLSEDDMRSLLADADACIASWGTPRFTEAVLESAPRLKLIAYSAGSVKPIVSEAVWERGIKVTTSAPAIAIDVAEFTIGLMIVALKRVLQFGEKTRIGLWRDKVEESKAKELYGLKIGIVGAGFVGRNVIRLLKNFEVSILVYDPYLSEEEAEELGVRKTSLEELMATSDVVSLHAPSLPQTYHMIDASKIKLLKDGAILINTARGALVDEDALVEELKTGRIFACIDVTDPEPPSPESPLRSLPNVLLTPHIAGSIANGLHRVGRYAIEEIYRMSRGEPLRYEIRREMLDRMA